MDDAGAARTEKDKKRRFAQDFSAPARQAKEGKTMDSGDIPIKTDADDDPCKRPTAVTVVFPAAD